MAFFDSILGNEAEPDQSRDCPVIVKLASLLSFSTARLCYVFIVDLEEARNTPQVGDLKVVSGIIEVHEAEPSWIELNLHLENNLQRGKCL